MSRTRAGQLCDCGWDLLGQLLKQHYGKIVELFSSSNTCFDCLSGLSDMNKSSESQPSPPCCWLYNWGTSSGDIVLTGCAQTRGLVATDKLKLKFTFKICECLVCVYTCCISWYRQTFYDPRRSSLWLESASSGVQIFVCNSFDTNSTKTMVTGFPCSC